VGKEKRNRELKNISRKNRKLIIQVGRNVGSAKSKGISVSNALAERKLGLIDLFRGRSIYEGQPPKVNYFYLNRVKRLSEHFIIREN